MCWCWTSPLRQPPQSAEEVLVAIRRLNQDLGLTVILAEHRLERVVQLFYWSVDLPGAGQPRCWMSRAPVDGGRSKPTRRWPRWARPRAGGPGPSPSSRRAAFCPHARLAGCRAQRRGRERHPGGRRWPVRPRPPKRPRWPRWTAWPTAMAAIRPCTASASTCAPARLWR